MPSKDSLDIRARIIPGLFLVLVTLAMAGCVTSRRAAERIVSAPNRHGPLPQNQQMLSLWTLFETNLVPPRIKLPMRKAEIPVGPPAASINILELPPQDYHVTVSTEITPLRNGQKAMVLKVVSTTNVVSRVTPSDPPATIILLHGYLMTKESMAPWAFQLAQAGYRVILVDLRGHGGSTGDTVSFGRAEVTDLRQVLDYLVAHGQCDASVGVLGYSFGATLALHWAAHDPRIHTVVAIAPLPVSSPGQQTALMESAIQIRL